MSTPVRYEWTQEPLDDEERYLMDPNNWDWEHPIEGVTIREPAVTLRFSREEYLAFWRLAPEEGLPTEEVIKRAALAHLPQDATSGRRQDVKSA